MRCAPQEDLPCFLHPGVLWPSTLRFSSTSRRQDHGRGLLSLVPLLQQLLPAWPDSLSKALERIHPEAQKRGAPKARSCSGGCSTTKCLPAESPCSHKAPMEIMPTSMLPGKGMTMVKIKPRAVCDNLSVTLTSSQLGQECDLVMRFSLVEVFLLIT